MASPQKRKSSGIFYFRRRVPSDLTHVLGREVVVSLKTRDKAEAKRRFIDEAVRFDDVVARERRKLSVPFDTLTEPRAEALAGAWLQDALDADEARRMTTEEEPLIDVSADVTAHALALEEIERINEMPTRRKREAVLAFVAEALAETVAAHDLNLEQGSVSEDRLAQALLTARWRAETVFEKRTRDRWREAKEQRESVLADYPKVAAKAAALRNGVSIADGDGPCLRTVFEKWKAGRPTLAKKTLIEFERAVRRFEDLHGVMPAASVTRAMVRDFKEALMQLPASVPSSMRSMPLPELLEAGVEGPRLSAGSVNKYIGALHTLFRWAGKHLDFVEREGWANPARDLAIDGNSGGTETDRDYTIDDLKLIFGSPVFTENARPLGGCGEAAKWMPLIAAYTGARLAELGGLRVIDVQELKGVWFLNITPHAGRRLKTKKSRRQVALHPDLLSAGFLEYVKATEEAGHKMVFPQIKKNSADQVGASWSKWWGRYTTSLGIVDEGKVFHSFRHTFKTACRIAGMPEDVHDAMTGHSNGSVGRDYGKHLLLVQDDYLPRVKYAGLDLSHICGRAVGVENPTENIDGSDTRRNRADEAERRFISGAKI